jgi:hypothetical protein
MIAEAVPAHCDRGLEKAGDGEEGVWRG